jgi:hypothetical protein
MLLSCKVQECSTSLSRKKMDEAMISLDKGSRWVKAKLKYVIHVLELEGSLSNGVDDMENVSFDRLA